MPIQTINYLAAPVQGDPMLAAIIPGLISGMKMANYPQEEKQKLINDQLTNGLLQTKLQYAPEMSEAQIKQMQAEAAYKALMTSNPLLGMAGPAGQMGAIQYLRGMGKSPNGNFQSGKPVGAQFSMPSVSNQDIESSPYALNDAQINKLASSGIGSKADADVLQQALTSTIASNQAKAEYTQKRANAFGYATAPVDAKTATLAQLHGMGLTTDEGVNELSSGKTIPEIAVERGFDPRNMPQPDYDPTRGNVDKLQQRRMYLNELDNVQDFVNKGLAPYSRKFMGYSPKQVMDAIKNDNPEQQARFIASRGLQPELASMRLNIAGGRVGLGSIQEMMNKALGNSRIFEGSVSPQVYQRAQELMNQQITGAFEKASQNLMKAGHQNIGQPANVITANQPSISTNQESSTAKIIGPDGRTWSIPRDKLQAAIARGAKEVTNG